MTKNDEKLVAGRAYSMTSIPDVMGFCLMNKTAPALRTPGTTWIYHSPEWELEHLLQDAAEESLKGLLTPTLVAWAHHWRAVGMKPKALAEVLDMAISTGQAGESTRMLVRELLNVELLEYEEAEEVRCVVEVAKMPTVLGIHSLPGAVGRPALMLSNDRRMPFSIPHGSDALLVRQVDGSALLLFTSGGRVDQGHPFHHALIVPAHLVDEVNGLLTTGNVGFDLSSAEPMAADD